MDLDGTERSRSYRRRVDAQRFRVKVGQRVGDGQRPDGPAPGAITVEQWSAVWLSAQAHLKATTRARYEGVLRRHVLPRWGAVPLDEVRHADVAAWAASLSSDGIGPATVTYAYRVLALVLEFAVRDGLLARNPARGVRLPRNPPSRRRYLTHAQVADLADAAGRHRLVILVLAYCGLRWGELAALRVGDVDVGRRRLEVARSVTEVRGRLVWSTPKSHQRRSVPIPRFLAEQLAHDVAGADAERPLFATSRGRVLRNLNFRRDCFDPAATRAGLPGLTPHDLRHTAASLAISAGANVKAVQRMLGHASAAMTLDVYAELFEDDLDEVAAGLDAQAVRRTPAPGPGPAPRRAPGSPGRTRRATGDAG